MKTPRILIIAGSDSGGGAGIQADIKTVTMLGGHAMTAITAITAQNTLGVQAVMPVPTAMVLAQIESCVSDIGVDAVKIGMVGSTQTANDLADTLGLLRTLPFVRGGKPIPIVFDPVMVATSGDVLADAETIAAFARLMRIATVTTPNLPELDALLSAVRPEPVEGLFAKSAALAENSASTGSARTEQGAGRLARTLGTAVLVKGGHGEGGMVIDRLIEADGSVTCWRAGRMDTDQDHGTGCTLASAIAVGLGTGVALADAIVRARRFVRSALANAPGLGGGRGPMGHAQGVIPFDLLRNRDA